MSASGLCAGVQDGRRHAEANRRETDDPRDEFAPTKKDHVAPAFSMQRIHVSLARIVHASQAAGLYQSVNANFDHRPNQCLLAPSPCRGKRPLYASVTDHFRRQTMTAVGR